MDLKEKLRAPPVLSDAQVEAIINQDAKLYMNPVPIPLFVYGTMKAGFRNASRLAGRGVRNLGTFVTRHSDFCLKSKVTQTGYYAPVLLPGYSRIRGELYMVPGYELWHIDMSEGHPLVYRRERVFLDGVEDPVEVYAFGNTDKTSLYDFQIEEENGVQEFIL